MGEGNGLDRARQAAAARGAALVRDGMTLGLGTGRAATAAIRAVGERLRVENIRLRGAPTSEASRLLALELGIPLVDPGSLNRIDLMLDGADEADPWLNVIKGGGGALVREKLLSRLSDQVVFMIEPPKAVERLGSFPLPVAVIPFAWQSTRERILRHCNGAALRQQGGKPFVTDDGLYILDLDTGPITDPAALEAALLCETGVVEVGLFVGICTLLLIGQPDGAVRECLPPEEIQHIEHKSN